MLVALSGVAERSLTRKREVAGTCVASKQS